MAVSLYHQGDNLDRALIAGLTGRSRSPEVQPPRPPLTEWLRSWIEWDGSPQDQLDSLPGVMWHMSDAWRRRAEPNVVLVHYQDLSDDLEGEMRRLAASLGVTVPEQSWPALARAASFEHMKARAAQVAPDPVGVLRDRSAFFRRGSSGAGREALTQDDLARFRSRTSAMAPGELLAWLHRV